MVHNKTVGTVLCFDDGNLNHYTVRTFFGYCMPVKNLANFEVHHGRPIVTIEEDHNLTESLDPGVTLYAGCTIMEMLLKMTNITFGGVLFFGLCLV